MRNTIRLLIVLVAAGAACAIDGTEGATKTPFTPSDGTPPYIPTIPPATRRVVILHTNDEHSHLLGFAPTGEFAFVPEPDGSVTDSTVATIATKIMMEADQQTVGGLVRRQYLINDIRENSPDPVLLLSGGDVMMGTVTHLATTDASPDYVAMALLGYDFITLGNHEFDWGPDALAQAIVTVNNTVFGGAVPLLAANIHFDDVQAGGSGSGLQSLYGAAHSGAPITPYAVKVLANGLKVGLLGLVGYDAALVAPGKSPISFSTPGGGAACTGSDPDDTGCPGLPACIRSRCVNPLDANGHIGAMAAETQAVVNTLRDTEGVDLVVALTHLGQLEDAALVSFTTGIDVVIGGHSHDEVHVGGQFPLMQVPWAGGGGQAIIVQAGSYGRKLGRLTVTVAPDGAVGYDLAESELIAVDFSVDQQILLGTDLLASPPVLSPAFETALNVTGGVIGPVIGGINAFIGPMLGGLHVLSPVAASTYDIVGEAPFQDSSLLHLVTDAQRAVVMQGACLQHNPAAGQYVVAVQANGVIRESLRFPGPVGRPDPTPTTLADVFQVLPLGASPLDLPALPGYPIVLFRLAGVHLFAGLDVGVTNGLQADSFFLSYAGMRVSYDTTRSSFNPDALPAGDPGGRVTKIEIADGAGWVTIFDLTAGATWVSRWINFNPFGDTVVVITNLYLAGFLEAFGITPLKPDGVDAGTPFDPDPLLGGMETLGQMILCQVAQAPDCGAGAPAMRRCYAVDGQPPWNVGPTPLTEVKEWAALFAYMRALPVPVGGTLPTFPPGLYEGDINPRDAVRSRVVDVSP